MTVNLHSNKIFSFKLSYLLFITLRVFKETFNCIVKKVFDKTYFKQTYVSKILFLTH